MYAIERVVVKGDDLIFGIGLGVQIAVFIVSVAPAAKIRIDHGYPAPQGVITKLRLHADFILHDPQITGGIIVVKGIIGLGSQVLAHPPDAAQIVAKLGFFTAVRIGYRNLITIVAEGGRGNRRSCRSARPDPGGFRLAADGCGNRIRWSAQFCGRRPHRSP